MAWVCQICNGMASYVVKCSDCGEQMEARGAIQDYFDDYSPYLSRDLTKKADGVEHNRCVHLFYCAGCASDKRVTINEILM